MSSPGSSSNADVSQKKAGIRWNPFKSRSSKSESKVTSSSVKSGGYTGSHTVTNYISGGQGGSGGVGGSQGGGGGTGEGPTLQYNTRTEHFTVNNVHTGSAAAFVHASQPANHCPPPSRIFHGRKDILDKMHQFFARDIREQKIYVLYGLGGAGKTQIALKFIEESTYFTGQFLVDTSSTETIETSLKNIVTAEKIGNSSHDALTWLASRHEDWLLFFDNADDPQINLHRFLPKCNHGNIIITSRNPGLKVYGAYSHVSDLKPADSVALLLKSAHQEISQTNELLAADIVKELAYLPLAIVQAGAFISESGALDSYLALYGKHKARLLREKPAQSHDDYTWTAYTTWQMSFDKLSPLAAMFLQLCSFLHQEGISEEIFSQASRVILCYDLPKQELCMPLEFLSSFMDFYGEWDSLCFSKLTNELKAYSLINYHAERLTFSIHPLVHSWSQTTIDNQDLYHSCMSRILGMAIDGTPHLNKELASLRLIAHIDSLRQNTSNLAPDFQQQYALIYYYVGRYTEAEELGVMDVERTKKLWGDNDWHTLHAMGNLAITYDQLGKLKEAEKLIAIVLEKQRKLLGDDHPETVNAMLYLSTTYGNLGQFEEAKKLQTVVLEKHRKLFGDDHQITLDTMGTLALTYDHLKKFKEAEELQVKVLEKQRELLGDDHPKTSSAMTNLAWTCHAQGKFVWAEKLRISALEKRRKLYGDNHRNTQFVMQGLHNTYLRLNKKAEAAELKKLIINERTGV
ncbi:P-loop containing nucleoside triphosphate hydrolase protein [Mycena sanguinolenta]|nr:P-loop containing nucleoside triphosphate hydrolase protein [Mycena sanguinolenta]